MDEEREERREELPDEGRGRKVRNREIADVYGLKSVESMICEIEEKREWIRGRMYTIQSVNAGRVPGGTRRAGLDDVFAKLSEEEEKYERALKMYLKQQRKAERAIRRIQSEDARMFVRLYYMARKTKRETMEEMGITEWTFRNLRERVENAEDMAGIRWADRYTRRKDNDAE